MSSPRPAAEPPLLVPSLVFIALVVAAVGSLGAPLVTSVAAAYGVSLASAQWTLTITLLAGAVATPVLGRLASGPRRRPAALGTLGIVTAGSLLTVLPVPGAFCWLLAGRAAQGVGLALPAVMMGVARDHLAPPRAASTIALVSVASTIGIGVGYPLAALLTELAGVRAAYGLGLLVTALALVAGLRSLPPAPAGRSARLDVAGALLLAGGLVPLLLVVSETGLWSRRPGLAAGLAGLAVLLLAGWVILERRTAFPLVDLRLAGRGPVLAANGTMLAGGLGMYLLLTLITRYAQTPPAAGYGLGLSTFVAGLILVPFSALGFVAGRLSPLLGRRLGAAGLLAVNALVVLGAALLFALARAHLVELVTAMGVLGFGVGGFSAAMPAVILATTPPGETASAMSLNHVVRSVGFSLGSALGGLVLAGATPAGRRFPTDAAYATAACLAATALAAAAVTGLAVSHRRRPAASEIQPERA
ncbi:MFS transporter [Frankia sp. AgB1.9]|uniref:MFS transporter n=1 Tax=unclassified Frankia TaxID=2632575 RepID=UPI00193201EA|nr:MULTISPECIES: MFS transporter [unclassified Frankia]MBL7489342.1 MFS transporter [Frankia sp. AgW1.1]MBL7549403.1 MFS transporter [Frankia sp. AgB1.9]MBL7623109.1 MFS transporter [Frankia sp. AgB1.8]